MLRADEAYCYRAGLDGTLKRTKSGRSWMGVKTDTNDSVDRIMGALIYCSRISDTYLTANVMYHAFAWLSGRLRPCS